MVTTRHENLVVCGLAVAPSSWLLISSTPCLQRMCTTPSMSLLLDRPRGGLLGWGSYTFWIPCAWSVFPCWVLRCDLFKNFVWFFRIISLPSVTEFVFATFRTLCKSKSSPLASVKIFVSVCSSRLSEIILKNRVACPQPPPGGEWRFQYYDFWMVDSINFWLDRGDWCFGPIKNHPRHFSLSNKLFWPWWWVVGGL